MLGKLVSFEGIDGAGKTTQVQLLRSALQKRGEKVVLTREPGGTHVAEQIRAILLDPLNKDLDDLTEVLLYQAARSQVYQEIVLPALARGETVIMDRSLDSSIVYQGIARGVGADLITDLNKISTRDTLPDITFLLDLPVKVSRERQETSGEAPDRIEQEKRSFHHKVRQGYLMLYEADGGQRIKKIDATQPVEKVFAKIWRLLEELERG